MRLDRLVRKVVGIAHKTTGSLQSYVDIEPWIGQQSSGAKPVYGSAVRYPCIVEFTARTLRMGQTEEIKQVPVITILTPIAANGAEGRREPVDNRDKVTLATGHTGPILDVKGVLDPTTQAPYAYQIELDADRGGF